MKLKIGSSLREILPVRQTLYSHSHHLPPYTLQHQKQSHQKINCDDRAGKTERQITTPHRGLGVAVG